MCDFIISNPLAVSLKDLTKVSPDWIKLDQYDNFLRILSNRSPDSSYQVETCVKEYQNAFPEGAFRDSDDISAILKTIAAVGAGRVANRRFPPYIARTS